MKIMLDGALHIARAYFTKDKYPLRIYINPAGYIFFPSGYEQQCDAYGIRVTKAGYVEPFTLPSVERLKILQQSKCVSSGDIATTKETMPYIPIRTRKISKEQELGNVFRAATQEELEEAASILRVLLQDGYKRISDNASVWHSDKGYACYSELSNPAVLCRKNDGHMQYYLVRHGERGDFSVEQFCIRGAVHENERVKFITGPDTQELTHNERIIAYLATSIRR